MSDQKLTPAAQAWLAGVKSREAGQPRAANPYVVGNDETSSRVELSIQWFGGWDEANVIMSFHKANNDQYKDHPEYAELGIFAGYGEFDEVKE